MAATLDADVTDFHLSFAPACYHLTSAPPTHPRFYCATTLLPNDSTPPSPTPHELPGAPKRFDHRMSPSAARAAAHSAGRGVFGDPTGLRPPVVNPTAANHFSFANPGLGKLSVVECASSDVAGICTRS